MSHAARQAIRAHAARRRRCAARSIGCRSSTKPDKGRSRRRRPSRRSADSRRASSTAEVRRRRRSGSSASRIRPGSAARPPAATARPPARCGGRRARPVGGSRSARAPPGRGARSRWQRTRAPRGAPRGRLGRTYLRGRRSRRARDCPPPARRIAPTRGTGRTACRRQRRLPRRRRRGARPRLPERTPRSGTRASARTPSPSTAWFRSWTPPGRKKSGSR